MFIEPCNINISDLHRLHIQVAASTDEPFIPALWDRFLGFNQISLINHVRISPREICITDYVGQPLSEELWRDVIYYIQATAIEVIRPGDKDISNPLGYPEGSVRIFLDQDGLIESINIVPRMASQGPSSDNWECLAAMALRTAFGDIDDLEPEPLKGRVLGGESILPMSLDHARIVMSDLWEWFNDASVEDFDISVAKINKVFGKDEE